MSVQPDAGALPDHGSTHGAYELLARPVQRQLYAMNWTELRPLQTRAIRSYLQSQNHLLLMAETAAGKTEAAFLPVLSSIAEEPEGSVRALYVGPLKALINDQFRRVETLCTHLEMPVHRWHGDVVASKKDALIKKPSGVLLITPESLESLLINRTAHLSRLFGGLRAIVIDELHAFLQGERGLHLASLLVRIARYRIQTKPPSRLLGLSATIGDPGIAQRYLAPDTPDRVEIILDDGAASEIQLRVHGYDGVALRASRSKFLTNDGDDESDEIPVVMGAIAQDLVKHCGAKKNLVFANAKGDIEMYADLANEACRESGVPEAFLVHHGSLSKELREDTEERMKANTGRGRTTICSSTLEMGIDIGSVNLVGQIGAPWSVASLKQRMGRSGREEGEPRRLRCYMECTPVNKPRDPIDLLPLELLRTVAVCELMLEGWVEPSKPTAIDLSTLTHQIMSTIAELGAVGAEELYARLCIEGPFRAVSTSVFIQLLRELGAKDVIEQGADGGLILGLLGEKLRAKHEFYAAFSTPLVYTLIAKNRQLGTLPMEVLPKLNNYIVFAAKRWKVVMIDADRRQVHVKPARGRKPPAFTGGGGVIHQRVYDKMLEVLGDDRPVVYLDRCATDRLNEARRVAREEGLACRRIIPLGEKKCLWMTWAGTAETATYTALLNRAGIGCSSRDVGLACECGEEQLKEILVEAAESPPDLNELAHYIGSKQRRKYDELLSDRMLTVGMVSELNWVPSADFP